MVHISILGTYICVKVANLILVTRKITGAGAFFSLEYSLLIIFLRGIVNGPSFLFHVIILISKFWICLAIISK